MDLKDFIRESLVQIATGIDDANVLLVNPKGIKMNRRNERFYGELADGNEAIPPGRSVQLIEFDVAVYADKKRQGEARGGLTVVSLEANEGVNEKTNRGSESRITFNIPMVMPQG